jgi:DNA-binding CsgD family transcriptional regulator
LTVKPLSPREQQVVDLWASGKTHKDIGFKLNISVNTVAEHLRRSRAKIGLRTHHEFLCHLIRQRVVDDLGKEVTAEVIKAISDAGARVPSLWLNIR